MPIHYAFELNKMNKKIKTGQSMTGLRQPIYMSSLLNHRGKDGRSPKYKNQDRAGVYHWQIPKKEFNKNQINVCLQQALKHVGHEHKDKSEGGLVVTAVFMWGNQVVCANIGDAPAWRYNKNSRFIPLYHSHSLNAEKPCFPTLSITECDICGSKFKEPIHFCDSTLHKHYNIKHLTTGFITHDSEKRKRLNGYIDMLRSIGDAHSHSKQQDAYWPSTCNSKLNLGDALVIGSDGIMHRPHSLYNVIDKVISSQDSVNNLTSMLQFMESDRIQTYADDQTLMIIPFQSPLTQPMMFCVIDGHGNDQIVQNMADSVMENLGICFTEQANKQGIDFKSPTLMYMQSETYLKTVAYS